MNGFADDGGLTGSALVGFLDRLDADLEAGGAEQVNLLARLDAQPLHPDILESLFRVCQMWWGTDQPRRALAVVAQDGPSLMARTPLAEQADTALHLALIDAWTGFVAGDESVAVRAVRQASQLVNESPALIWRDGGGPVDEYGYREWDILADLADFSLDTALAVFDFRWALDRTDPDLEDRRGVSEALFRAARAQAFQGYDRPESAGDEARKALTVMGAVGAPQVVDRDDWLTLGDAIIEIQPESLPQLKQAITAGADGLSPALRSEINIRVWRLRARALHAQGDLVGALALRGVTNGSLESGNVGEDDFFEYDVPWLVEAGRFDEAGERVAMYLCWYPLSDVHVDIIRPLISQRLADESDQSVWWPLCVMRVCAYGDLLLEDYFVGMDTLAATSPVHARLFGALASEPNRDLAARRIFDEARRLAEERSPGHPWIDRFSVLVERRQGRISDAEVATRLEAVVAAGVTEGTTLARYVMARVATLGLVQGLAMPLPAVRSGADVLRFTSAANDGDPHSRLEPIPVGLEDMTTNNPSEMDRAAAPMWHWMYQSILEQGVARMECFFATGEGHPGDANPHYYARLCQYLGNALCDELRFDDAIAVCFKGLQASPLPSLYSTILYAINGQRVTRHIWAAMDPAAQTRARQLQVDVAGALWRHMSEEGFAGSQPNEWIHQTVMHLHYLDRHDEIPLWLERLASWQERAGGEDPGHLSQEALYARVRCLQYMSNVVAHLGQCAVLIKQLEPQIAASTSWMAQAVAGVVFGNVGDIDDAIACYQRHLELNPQSTDEEIGWANDIARNLEQCRAMSGSSQPARRRRWW